VNGVAMSEHLLARALVERHGETLSLGGRMAAQRLRSRLIEDESAMSESLALRGQRASRRTREA